MLFQVQNKKPFKNLAQCNFIATFDTNEVIQWWQQFLLIEKWIMQALSHRFVRVRTTQIFNIVAISMGLLDGRKVYFQ